MANAYANIVQHLIERGLITYESVVDGDLMVTGGSSNHQNSRVMRSRSPGFFIKQIQRWEEPAISTLRREAGCYVLADADKDFAPLAQLLPKYYDFDPVRHILVIELMSGGESLSQTLLRIGQYQIGFGARLGQAMAAYHFGAGRHMKDSGNESTLALATPWILTILRQTVQSTNFNFHSQELLAFLQGTPQVKAALDGLLASWRTNSFIHGDIKWDNFIINHDENGGFDLKVIDWELAGFGDSCWDVGSVFQSFINSPLMFMVAAADQLPIDLQGLMRYCSPNARAAMREFWIAYVTNGRMDEATAGDCIGRSIQYCAARMLQTAFEMTEVLKGQPDKYYADMLIAKAYCFARIAIDILLNPAVSLGHVFAV